MARVSAALDTALATGFHGCAADTCGATLHGVTVPQPPTVTFHVTGQLRAYCAGVSQLAVSAATVRGALEDLERRQGALYRNVCDETGTLRRHLNVFVNSDNIRDRDGIETALAEGDVVTILPAVSGG